MVLVSYMDIRGLNTLTISQSAFPKAFPKSEAKSEVEQMGLGPVLIWDASITSSSFTHYTTTLALKRFFLTKY